MKYLAVALFTLLPYTLPPRIGPRSDWTLPLATRSG